MELNFEELAKKEVERQVKEKINGKLHNMIQKELKSHDFQKTINGLVNYYVKQHLTNENLIEMVDLELVNKQVIDNVSSILVERISTSHDYERY